MRRIKELKWVILKGLAIVGATGLAIWAITTRAIPEEVLVSTLVQRGPFVAEVYSTGQLQAENSTSIVVPPELYSDRIDIDEIQITEIVDEGTVVQQGDFVASLDYSAVEEVLVAGREALEASLRALEDARIDTNINMSNLRDGLLNAKVQVEERRLVLDQSIYESPAVKRQANLELERARQNLEQLLRNYELRQQQASHSVERALEEVRRHRQSVADIERLFEALDIVAPKPGMVIYSFDRFGSKIRVGSTVSRWAPLIAELPDLSSMISRTFINEIDISRVRIGQRVRIGVDAFPDKPLFEGEVISVANIGQTLTGGNTKVFEVNVRVFGSDPDIRPGMTTSNIITVSNIEDAVFIPLEAVFRTDTTRYVYTYSGGIVRQIVETGLENANNVVINQGLAEGQLVFMNVPTQSDDLPLKGLEIYSDLVKRAELAKKENESNVQAPQVDQPQPPMDSPGFQGGPPRGRPPRPGS